MSNKSGTSSQVITLPTGGGALQGIGETFSPDLFTGTGNFTVPLTLPPGRNGFQPKLALVYSSGNGNGPFGLGWSLDVPGITRKTSKGIPRYLDQAANLSEKDTFILSGAEDLVPISVPEPGVTRFQSRTEGMFARIEHIQSDKNDFWQVRSKDGLISLYGSPILLGGDPFVVADPTARNKIFSWKLSQTTDPFENRIEYQYLRDKGSDGSHDWDQLYLEKVQYIDYEKGGQTAFLASVTFIYEQRPDPFSDCRSGFEIRTRLRCKRIEVRTHADQDRLVRTYDLVYEDNRVGAGELPAENLPLNGVSLLSQVKVTGHDENLTENLPPLEFSYTRFALAPETNRFQDIRGSVNGALPPRSLADGAFEMVSLFVNGLPDIVQINGSITYWRNLGNGTFDRPQIMNAGQGGIQLSDPQVQLADMNGNGRADLLVLNQQGYFPLSFKGGFSQNMVQYASTPTVEFGNNDLRMMDLDGDGVTDALRTGTNFELYFNDPLKGWGTVETRPRQSIELFPDLNFGDSRVKLADLNGDKLQDFVLVQQGQVDYWPYLGHGKWGKRITTHYETTNVLLQGRQFDPHFIQFGDLDGDGVDDLFYIQPGRITFWINQGGNGWSDPITIDNTPQFTDIDAVRLVDVLGTGMSGILWSFDQAPGMVSNFKFLDLTAGLKPYLLEQMDNQSGAITKIQYVPSTKFYLADEQNPKTRWKVPLPFPVHVIERVEVIDEISKCKMTTVYAYHHGYWDGDGDEKELRGFGHVEQFDTETFENFNVSGLHGNSAQFNSVEAHQFSSQLRTDSWFHLGPTGDGSSPRTEADFSSEYWSGDRSALARPTDTQQLINTLPASQRGNAIRSLRGNILRTELYAVDGSDRENRPYTVTEYQYGIREENPPTPGEGNRQRIFFPHQVAQRTTQWERGDDPMTKIEFTDDYDTYGQPRRQISLAVPRKHNYRASAPVADPYLGTITKTKFAQRDDKDRYIVDRVAATTSFEILNDGKLAIFDLYQKIQSGTASLKLFSQNFNYYDDKPFIGLAVGELGDFGALVRTESLVLTEEILREAYRDPANPTAFNIPPYLNPGGGTKWTGEYPKGFQDSTPALAGYTFADGSVDPGSDDRARGYFAQTARVAFDFQTPGLPPRGLPVITCDALDNKTTIAYDEPYHLLPVEVIDPVGLITRAGYDYRVLQPNMTLDVNNNRRRFVFSPLGLLKETWVQGKTADEGDQRRPSSLMEYDFLAYFNSPPENRQPIFVRTIRYEHHDTETDVPLPDRDATIETIEFSDGYGRLIQTRTQAEDILFGDPNFGGGVLSTDQSASSGDLIGRQRTTNDPSNVIVSGWQIYDNKGRVVEKYEPFFAVGWEFAEPAENKTGQRVTMFYDPRGQVVRTVKPDGSEQRVIYGVPTDLTKPELFEPTPWEAYTYDANDLAPVSIGLNGNTLVTNAPASHHFTPLNIVIDALGRTVKAIVRNRGEPKMPGEPLPSIQEICTQTSYDIRGNVMTVTDALNRTAFRYYYDLANRPWRIESIDAGLRRVVINVLGNETEHRDSKGAVILHAYDVLQRPIHLWARDDPSGPVTMRQRLEYGDGGIPHQLPAQRAALQAKNLLGQLTIHHDEAGLLIVMAVDFKGNILDKSRRIIADDVILAIFQQAPANRWLVRPFHVDWETEPQQTLGSRESQLLETTSYQTTTTYDALNRLKRLQLPQDSEKVRRELQPIYNKAGGLEKVFLDNTSYVERITYDAKGQRVFIAYGNGVMTRYAYDPQTFRLKRLRSEYYTKLDTKYHLNSEPLQDFGYDYDLVGNMLSIQDRTPNSGILNNSQALSTKDSILKQLLSAGNALIRNFDYDPIYRLISATGRECDRPPTGPAWEDLQRGTDLTRARAYTEEYSYDLIGNILQMKHHNNSDGFIREFTVETTSNRLEHLQVGNDRFEYTFDPNGNLSTETSSRHFEWNHTDQMIAFSAQIEGVEPSVYAQYLYDAAGLRIKKLVRKQGGRLDVTHYLDGISEYHRWRHGPQAGENCYVHVMDDQKHIALVRIGLAHPDDGGPAIQFHLGDHLGSSNTVVDSVGKLANREEFTPYGETSFGSFKKKRYRFTGRERDEESGLTYHSARYYAVYALKWVSCDPLYLQYHNKGSKDENSSKKNFITVASDSQDINLYAYVRNNPLRYADPSGHGLGSWISDNVWIPGRDSLDELDVGRTAKVAGGVALAVASGGTASSVGGALIVSAIAADQVTSGILGTESYVSQAGTAICGGNHTCGAVAEIGATLGVGLPGMARATTAVAAEADIASTSSATVDTGLNSRLIRPEELITRKITVPTTGRGIGEAEREWARETAKRWGNEGPVDVAHIEPHVFTEPGQEVLVRPQTRSVNRAEGSSIKQAAKARREYNASQPDPSQHLPVRPVK
jgi:RHS repeat-associated protein